MSTSIPIGILGATGMVGQRMIQRLQGHPIFSLGAVAASARSAGKTYGEAASWRLQGQCPTSVVGETVLECRPELMPAGLRVVLSALDSSVARQIESDFRDAGFAVISNASAWRMDPKVPLVIPEVNPHALSLIDEQGPGYIVANPNCCAIPLAMALAPLHRRWGVEAVTVSTWQAVSGAGYPGESAWDMVGSVHPHAGNEEEKLAEEPPKILGTDFPISARCVRVPVADGHLLGIHVRLTGNPDANSVRRCLVDWQGEGPELPSCPRPPLRLDARRDRPSPRLDCEEGAGMAITIGRVEDCPVMGVKLYALGHNTIRGAAGAAIANAELLHIRGKLPGAL
jgi:aspartate-semialdehyde dehydrogenase